MDPVIYDDSPTADHVRAAYDPDDYRRLRELKAVYDLQNAARVRGKARIDLHVDPAPDLVVEIDITHPSLDKLPIYARLGVPEVWRYDGARLEILTLENDGYTARSSSRALPAVTADALMALLPRSMGVGDIAWMRSVRAWARTLPTPGTL